jgi:2-aminoadipate transaminase
MIASPVVEAGLFLLKKFKNRNNMITSETKFADRVKTMPESFIREILKVAANPGIISFAGGLPNPLFFPSEKIAAAAEKVLTKEGSVVLQYAPTEGYAPLRDFIAQRQSKKSGTQINAEDVLILNGSQQGLDLMGKLFLNSGSHLLLESPSYLGAIQAFSAYQPSFHEVEMEENGPVLESLNSMVGKYDPVVFYTIPTFQNPTGKTYDLEHRLGVVEACHNSDVVIIEDNPYGDIYFEKINLPDLHSLMPAQTVQLGSFSKIISPGLRLGWAIGPNDIVKKMTVAKQACDLHSSNFGQRIIYQFLLDNALDDHLENIREFYNNQAQIMGTLMNRYFSDQVTWTQPKGGMFIWITLPEKIDARILLADAIREGVLFVPGNNFFVNSAGQNNTIRMNFSNPSETQMEVGIKIMARLIEGCK